MPIKGGKFEYPENGWSTGSMRRRGKLPAADEEEPRQIQPAKFFGRGNRGMELQFGNPEFEKLAGAGFWARGGARGGPRTPDDIQADKAQTQGFGQQHLFPPNVRKMEARKKAEERQQQLAKAGDVDLLSFMDTVGLPVEMFTGVSVSEGLHKMVEMGLGMHLSKAQQKGETEVKGFNEKGKMGMIPIGDFDPSEQTQRFMDATFRINVRGKKEPQTGPEGGIRWSEMEQEE